MIKFYSILFAFIFTGLTYAKDVDMTFDIDFEQIDNLETGQSYNFSITLINQGPEDAGTETTDAHPIAAFGYEFFQVPSGYLDLRFSQDATINQDCIFIDVSTSPPPGGVPAYSIHIRTPVIKAYSTHTCYGKFKVRFTSGFLTKTFAVVSAQDNELNWDDNFKDVVFSIKPQPIPYLNKLPLILLAISFIVIGVWRFKRQVDVLEK